MVKTAHGDREQKEKNSAKNVFGSTKKSEMLAGELLQKKQHHQTQGLIS